MKNTGRAELLGVSFEAYHGDAVARCLEFCRAPRTSNTVITANASHLCMMRRDSELAASCRAARMTVADGMSVVWALRASGQPAPERVAGVDLMARLLAAAGEQRSARVFPRRTARRGHSPGGKDACPVPRHPDRGFSRWLFWR